MGLDVSHDAWRGAYSAFMRWRLGLCEAAGYELIEAPDRPGSQAPAIWYRDCWTEGNYQGEWESLPEDPLIVLIVHSDCDGVIPAQACPWLADRLEGLLPSLAARPDQGIGHIGSWPEKTRTFIDGLRAAAEKGEDLEFY